MVRSLVERIDRQQSAAAMPTAEKPLNSGAGSEGRKLQHREGSPFLNYGVAIAATIAATLLRASLTPLIGPTAVPFIMYFPAVLCVSWYAGLRPAVLSIALSAFAGEYLFLAPTGSFRLDNSGDSITIALFVLVGFAMAFLAHSQRQARQRAEEQSVQRMDAQSAEREIRERLQITLSSIGDAVLSTDAHGCIVFANRIALGILKLTEADVLGRHLDEVFRIFNEYTRAVVESPVAKVFREGKVVGMANHTVLITPDGREVPIDDSAAPIHDAQGTLRGTVLVFRDITDCRRSERTAQLLASIVESSDDAIISKDTNGIVTSWNAGAERMFGYTADEMIGKPISILAPPQRQDEMPTILERIKTGERIEHYETVRRAKNGALVDISLTVSPVRDSAGKIVGASKVARDISERKRAIERLRESEQDARQSRDWLQTVLSSIGDAVIATNAEGCVTFLNGVAEKLTGWTQEEARQRPLDDVFVINNEETGAQVESPVTKALREGRIVGLANHTRLTSKDGRQLPIDDSAAPIRDATGTITGVVLVFRDVTERKQAEAEARQSVERFRTMADHAPVLIWMAGIDKLCNWFNKPWLDFVGRTMEQEFGNGWAENVHADDFDRCLHTYVMAFDRREPFKMEYRLKRHDGEYRWVLDHGTPLHDQRGEFTGYIGSCIDVTDHKNSEQQLVQVQEQLKQELAGTRGLHELGPRLLALGDWRLVLSEILTSAREITGADMGNIQLLDSSGALRIEAQHGFNKEFLDFFDSVHEDDSSVCGAALTRRERIVVEDVEKSAIFAGTPALSVLLNAGVRAVQSTPLITHAGALVGVLSTHYRQSRQPSERDLRLIDLLTRQAADLIAKTRVESELRSARQQLTTITDNMAAAVTQCSKDLRYLWVSPAYADWLGLAADQVIGRPIREVVGPKGFDDIRPYMERVLSGEKVDYTTKVHFRSTGERWIHAVYIPTFSEDHLVDGWTAVVTDITQEKKSEERLLKANADLARANEDLNQFAFAASHDLQEPLRMITAYSQLLVKGYRGQLNGDAATSVEYITEGTKRMRALLADLLAYTQLTDTSQEALTPVDLNEVFAKTLENCKAAIDETHAIVTSETLPTVPGYEPHFVQLLQNLISNALKYRSEQPPQIHVFAEQQGHFWRLAVTDNGMGIDPEYHQQIFGVFKRLHGKNISGTGIGLAICKKIVDRYAGRIWVESEPGKGATFYFTVPDETGATAHA